jgi:hypothetical protein
MAKASKKTQGDYQIGYGRPPPQHQFKSGRSGNPKGRPRGNPTTGDVFMKEAARLIRIKKGEDIETITKLEGIVRRLLQMALEGDVAAARLAFAVLAQPGTNDGQSASPEHEEFGDISDDVMRRMLARFEHLRDK